MSEELTTIYSSGGLALEANRMVKKLNAGLSKHERRTYDHWELAVTNRGAFLHVFCRDNCGNLCQTNLAL